MKLKSKMVLAFLTVIMIPIVMLTVVGGVILSYQSNSMQALYNVDGQIVQYITNPIQILNKMTRSVYNTIKLCALKSPDKFENKEYLNSLNNELLNKYSFIVVRKNKDFIFTGNEKEFESIKDVFPEFGVYTANIDGGIYIEDSSQFLLKQQDFYFSDNSEGSIFIVTDVNTLIPQLKSFILQFLLSFIAIMILTASIFTYWLYSSILRPLNTLKIAANQIKVGNLDFTLEVNSDDEIGQLCNDFEEMRKHLKELIEVRMQYEVDSKELISNISHDLKTPLTAIKGYAEGIMDGVAATPEKMEKYLKIIYTKANDMTSLVDELSFYSKIDCNTIPYTFKMVNLDEYFRDCIDEISLDLEVKNIDIAYFNYADKSTNVIIDVEQLKRVINNIIGNSAKYIEATKGIINVRISEDDYFVKVEIEDNGKGIAKEDLEKIFERFYRTDASRNSSKGGSGLGLAISKKIIEDHNGSIWASSKEGVGTIIHFTLRKADNNNDILQKESNKNTKSSSLGFVVKD